MVNRAILGGEVVNTPELYKVLKSGTVLVRFLLKVKRTSGYEDMVPCIVKERFAWQIKKGEMVKVNGRVMTNNLYPDGKCKLDVYVYVDKAEEFTEYENHVEFEGVICKENAMRTTMSGKVIVDFILAHNLNRHVSAYVPSIAWYENAVTIDEAKVGDRFLTIGRFQSREYSKNGEPRTAFEYCICSLLKVKKEAKHDECENEICFSA